ncbi:hypothetical protein F383_29620 [Gossypium arboreum]|nr:hypothetical protein F383_29620 [Gossypium arboreum]
MNLRNS